MNLSNYYYLALFWLILTIPANACENGYAIISGAEDYPPLTWREGDKLTGASVKLVKMLFSEVGIDAQSDEGGPWKRVLLRARRNQVDMLLGVRKTVARESYLTYITPAITPSAQSVFVASKKDFPFTTWTDLEGKAGGVTLGSSFGKRFDFFSRNHLNLEQARTIEQNFKKLKRGRLDYILGPLVTVNLHLEKMGYTGEIINKPTPLMIINEYLAIAEGSSCHKYVAHFKKRVTEMQRDGSWDAIMEDQFTYWFESNKSSYKKLNIKN